MSFTDLLQPRSVRTKIIFVRVTDEERKAIAKAAADAGIPSVADFMRDAAREKILELIGKSKRSRNRK